MSQSLLAKYAPKGLADIVGQPAAVESLKAFVAAPFPTAFIFAGPTGVGKTCTAKALAADLGCDLEEDALGGFNEIASGSQDGSAVQDLFRSLRLCTLYGSGWRIALVNEADYMTPQAEAMWLDKLENLPPRVVIIFTTNDVHRLTKRLIGRCELLTFDGNSPELIDAMNTLIRKIWKNETGNELVNLPPNLGKFDEDSDVYSIRLAIQQIAPLIRTGVVPKAPTTAAAVPAVKAKPKPREGRTATFSGAAWRQKAATLGIDWSRVYAAKAVVRAGDRTLPTDECWRQAFERIKKESKVPA